MNKLIRYFAFFVIVALVVIGCASTVTTSQQIPRSKLTSTSVTNPITYTKGTVFTIAPGGLTSWVYVPTTYDSTHQTPTSLLVWLHGCGGRSQYDIVMVSPGGSQNWISLAPGGREGTCWSSYATDGAKILAAIADIKTHFNIDSRRVVLGGYSSGGDIGYPLIFANANMFAGAIFENTGPSSAALTASTSAAWKLNIAHLAHTGDTTYPIANIRNNMQTLRNNGFPVTFIEKPGTHWDNDTATSGTKYDLVNTLLPFMNVGWVQGTVPSSPCVYVYSAWSTCSSTGLQTRTATSSPNECVGTPVLSQTCTYTPPVCVYTYTNWGVCQSNNTQTRTVTATYPANCLGSSITTQSCVYVPPPLDTDGDGVPDSTDKCPTVKGSGSTDPARNGCVARFTITSKSTYDWGSGYCKEFYFTNNTNATISWKSVTINMKDAKLRGQTAFWGAILPDYFATGFVKGTPVSHTSPVGPGKTVSVGLCANYGPLKSQAVLSSIAY